MSIESGVNRVFGLILAFFAMAIVVMSYFWTAESSSVTELVYIFVVIGVLVGLAVSLIHPWEHEPQQ